MTGLHISFFQVSPTLPQTKLRQGPQDSGECSMLKKSMLTRYLRWVDLNVTQICAREGTTDPNIYVLLQMG